MADGSHGGAAVPSTGHTVSVARQRIEDAAGVVVGHELLFRPSAHAHSSGAEDQGGEFDDDVATATVISVVTSEFDLAEVGGTGLLFVNVPRSFVVGELPLGLEPGQVVLELLERVSVDEDVRRGLERLRADGFMLALDDVVPDDPRLVLAALCDYVKVDLTDAPGDLLGALVRQVRAAAPDAVLLAERVETEADRGRALAAGFTLLQGYLLSRPTVLRRDALRHHAPTAAALLLRLADPHTSASTLGALAASDPAIAAKLLRAVNNVTGARLEVADLGRAIALLGRSRLTALLVLDVVASFGHDDPESPLLAVARTRAAQLLCPDEPLAAATEALARLCARLLGCDRHEARAWLGVPPAAPAVAEACDALDSYLDAADLGAVPQLVDPYTPLDVSIVWLSGLREGRELLARLS